MTTPSVVPQQVDPQGPPPPPPHWTWRVGKFAVAIIVIVVVFIVGRDFAERLAEEISPEPSDTLFVLGQEIEVVIPPGSSARSIAAVLESSGVIQDAGFFEQQVAETETAAELKAGEYVLISGASVTQIIDTLVAGPAPQEVITVRVVEGLTIEEMLVSIAAQTPHRLPELRAALLDGRVESAYLPDVEELPEGIPELAHWEGLLFPDTYEVLADGGPAQILNRMARTLERRLESIDWTEIEADAGITPYEGLIIASMIEREAKLDDERPMISSVIYNRLEDGQALQIDATVLYALGERNNRVLQEDLEVDSPYNTYQVTGLPPTPIGGVRLLSLDAAANPADTEFRYYVVVDEDGSHAFAETFEEHQANIARAEAAGVR